MLRHLDRPTPALPHSYFWTWDHKTNFVLDDPGNQTFGCYNRYLKRPETFVEDYRRLTDLAAALGVKGIVIWGFLRDTHGGIEFAKRVSDYAASRSVAIMPGIGTTHYGGVYYEGDHPYNIETFLRKNPDAYMIKEDGTARPGSACSSHPAFREWMAEGLEWLFREFAIGGINLENGDLMVCHCPRCKEHKAGWPADDPDFFRLQAMSYVPALETLRSQMPDNLITWAAYTGFLPDGVLQDASPGEFQINNMYCQRPVIMDRAPEDSMAQWTLTGMVRQRDAVDERLRPLPLLAYLDDGVPAAALDMPQWPKDVIPPSGTRHVGFMHQGNDSTLDRYELVISTIKEGCLRAYRAGMTGVSVHGEVTPRHAPWALNYLALSHFIHWPEDSLRDFGRKTLGQVMDSAEEGEVYVELLAHLESGPLTEPQHKEMINRTRQATDKVYSPDGRAVEDIMDRWRLWDWLYIMDQGPIRRHVINTY